jgi:hypothetical protein
MKNKITFTLIAITLAVACAIAGPIDDPNYYAPSNGQGIYIPTPGYPYQSPELDPNYYSAGRGETNIPSSPLGNGFTPVYNVNTGQVIYVPTPR